MNKSRNLKKKLPEQVTPEQATAILKQANKERVDKCYAEIEMVLRKHGCTMQAETFIVGNEIKQRVAFYPQAPQQASPLNIDLLEEDAPE